MLLSRSSSSVHLTICALGMLDPYPEGQEVDPRWRSSPITTYDLIDYRSSQDGRESIKGRWSKQGQESVPETCSERDETHSGGHRKGI